MSATWSHRVVRIACTLLLVSLATPLLGIVPAQAASPTVAAFLPITGAPGTSVTITGVGFSDASPATAVAFNGTAATFTVGSNLQITATVPAGASTGAISVTDAEGTSSSLLPFTVTSGSLPLPPIPSLPSAPPLVAAFLPLSGPVGTSVTITGTGLSGATDVAFNGTPATFTPRSDIQLTATVPAGATTGTIAVITPAGTATSSLRFTVNGVSAASHTRSLTLRLRGQHASGMLTADDGFAACGANARIQIQRHGRGGWHTVRSVNTSAFGRFQAKIHGRRGTYRAVASQGTVDSGMDVCVRGISPSRHRAGR